MAVPDETPKRALDVLSRQLIAQHGDYWLADFLRQASDARVESAARLLADAIRSNSQGDREAAYRDAVEAERIFGSAGNSAGALRAAVEASYSLSRSFHSGECLDKSAFLLSALANLPYPWAQAQVLLDRSTCLVRLGDFGGAETLIEEAIALSDRHGLMVLSLRGVGLDASFRTELGDYRAARRQDLQGLHQFWKGVFPPLRAYQFYSDLSHLAEREEHWEAGYQICKQAVPMITLAGNRMTEAMARYRLAIFAGMTGRREESLDEVRRANLLIEQSGQKSASVLRAENLILLAGFFLEQGRTREAQETLESFRASDLRSSILLQLAFHRAQGTMAVRMQRMTEARDEFARALSLAHRVLGTVRTARDRANWKREAGAVYRELVRLTLEEDRDSDLALALWETYRSAPIRTAPPEDAQASAIRMFARSLNDTSVLSFVQFDDSLAGWFFDDRGIHSFRTPLSRKEATELCSKFHDLTSQKTPEPNDARIISRKLYDLLIGPVEQRLDDRRTLALEPDGPCARIAFEALLDPNGVYLVDRVPVATSPGSFAIAALSPTRRQVDGSNYAAVVGDPRLTGDLVRIYPALPDAAREADFVAKLFRRGTLLSAGEATKSAVLNALPRANVFHFAGHGVTTSENGTLLLAAPESSVGGVFLEAAELEGALNQCRLAFLSACFTASGERFGPFNPDSMVQAFWRAGVPTVVATRWAVNSDVAARITRSFYGHLLQNQSPAAAMRSAAADVRKDPALSHPAFWAGFHVFGSPLLFHGGEQQ